MEQGFFSTKANRILGALTLVMVIIALASFSILNLSKAEQTDMPATISVDGKGEVLAVPDIGMFSFSVEAEGDTASAAQETSATKINDILNYLKEQGVAENDIETANYNLYPRYRYEERVCVMGSYCPPGERVQDGYTVNQSVTVKVRETDKAGDLITGVGERGATNISGLSFTIDDTDALRAEARDQAIADARDKAEKLADSLGVDIVRIIGYYENSGDYKTSYYAREESVSLMAGDSSAAPQLPMGEESTTVQVNVTYEIK